MHYYYHTCINHVRAYVYKLTMRSRRGGVHNVQLELYKEGRLHIDVIHTCIGMAVPKLEKQGLNYMQDERR